MKRLLITTAVGMGVTAFGGVASAQSGNQTNTKSTPQFVSVDTILDANITSRSDPDRTADVDDFVVDMRNGRLVFAIVDTNGILDTENKVVAIPYGALQWLPDRQEYVIQVTQQELANLPAFKNGDLAQLHEPSWYSALRGIFGERTELKELENSSGDEYSALFANAKRESISGKIVAVNREAHTAQGGMCYAVVIQPENNDGAQRTVLLGPISHLQSKGMIPSEGDTVNVSAVPAHNHDGERVFVAESVRLSGNTLQLRDKDGIPTWKPEGDRAKRSFYRLASELADGTIYAAGAEFGGVDDVVFEAHSGTAAYAIIGAGGVLGIDETHYPIPCGAFTLGAEDRLYIDMPASKLKLAPKLSEEGIDDLNSKEFATSVNDYYGVAMKRFDTDRSNRWMVKDRDNNDRRDR